MKKSVVIGAVIAVVIAILAIIFVPSFFKKEETKNDNIKNSTSNLGIIESSEDLSKLVDKIYEGQENLIPSLATQQVDIEDTEMVKYITGLDDAKNLQYVVVSEPMMSSQAYSLILAKVKDGVNADEIAKQMKDNVDTRKWICVTAEKLYATNHTNLICLVMSREELAKPIYNAFKEVVENKVGTELERTTEN